MNVIMTEMREHDACFTESGVRSSLGLKDDWIVLSVKDLAENDYRLPGAETAQWEKCILLTEYHSGFLSHHRLLMHNFPACLWCFAVFGTEGAMVQAELRQQAQFKASRCTNDAFCMVFDDANTFAQTKRVVNRQINDKYTCAVLSRNAACAQTMIELLEQMVDGDFHYVGDEADERLETADALILVGGSREDFLPSLSSASQILHMAVWYNQCTDGMTAFDKADFIYDLVNYLSGLGWDREVCRNSLYCAKIHNEICGWNWKKGKIGVARLVNDNQFVLWDRYGLPCPGSDYDEEHLQEFFDRVCLIDRLTQQMGMPKK